jgi:Flp pilus assembly protein TadG
MLRNQNRPAARSGTAAVEMAVVMNFVMLPLLIGVWEMGRVVQCQQIVAQSAREGARLAAQGKTIKETGQPIQIQTAIDPATNTLKEPNVKSAVLQTLHGSGLTNVTWSDLTVTFQYLNQPHAAAPPANDTTRQPYEGWTKQRFKVYVSIPYDKVKWTILGLVNPTTITYEVEWRIMVDEQFTVNENLPKW